MRETGIFEAKTHFSELVQEEGVIYCITKRGKPVAELHPVKTEKKVRLPFGYGKNTVLHMAEDFDAPLEDLIPITGDSRIQEYPGVKFFWE